MRSVKISIFMLFLITIFGLYGCSKQKHYPKVKESGYITVDQGKLFYQKFGSGGIPIVVLHGGPGLDQSYLQPQMLELAKNREVIFYDQRGSGKSLATPYSLTLISINQFTKDLEELRKQLKLDQFILLGHSWGGLLAMNYSINYPEHLAGLILVSTTPADYADQQAFLNQFAIKTQSMKNKIAPLFDFQALKKLDSSQITQLYRTVFSVYFYNPKKVSKLSLNRDKKSVLGGVKVMEMINENSRLNAKINLYPQLAKLRIPTLVIHGKQDIIPLWTAQKIKDTIPNAQMAILEECGHFPYIEKPEQLFSQINHFSESL